MKIQFKEFLNEIETIDLLQDATAEDLQDLVDYILDLDDQDALNQCVDALLDISDEYDDDDSEFDDDNVMGVYEDDSPNKHREDDDEDGDFEDDEEHDEEDEEKIKESFAELLSEMDEFETIDYERSILTLTEEEILAEKLRRLKTKKKGKSYRKDSATTAKRKRRRNKFKDKGKKKIQNLKNRRKYKSDPSKKRYQKDRNKKIKRGAHVATTNRGKKK